MLKRIALITSMLFAISCGSENTESPLLIPYANITPDQGADASVDATIIVDAELVDVAMPDQMLIDAMVLPACQDGEDNDGDGQTDYPIDDATAFYLDQEESMCGSLHVAASKAKGCTFGRKRPSRRQSREGRTSGA